MPVNESRSMVGEFDLGCVDNSYISIMPDRGGVPSHVPIERLTWPTYGQAERHIDATADVVRNARVGLPRERKSERGSDLRF